MSNQTISMSFMPSFVFWISSLGSLFVMCLFFFPVFATECLFSSGVKVLLFLFFFSPNARHFCLPAVMNLVPNERQRRSSWRRDVLSKFLFWTALRGGDLSWQGYKAGFLRWHEWRRRTLGLVWWPIWSAFLYYYLWIFFLNDYIFFKGRLETLVQDSSVGRRADEFICWTLRFWSSHSHLSVTNTPSFYLSRSQTRASAHANAHGGGDLLGSACSIFLRRMWPDVIRSHPADGAIAALCLLLADDGWGFSLADKHAAVALRR